MTTAEEARDWMKNIDLAKLETRLKSPGIDIHEETAKELFNTSSPTHEQRRKAKTLTLFYIYGVRP